jgi:hypothetical protein
MAFSLLANSSAGIKKNQEMELTIENPAKPDLSVSEPKIVAMMEYSEGSSSEVNSPVSLGEVQQGKIAEVDETMENFD